jgi:hypothetical protein
LPGGAWYTGEKEGHVLEMLDVAIGFVTVMLVVSLIIMSLTQAISSVLALRGAKLRAGLEQLIQQTAPSLAAQARTISEEMLKHPLISDASTKLAGRWKLASAIKKEELLQVLDAVIREKGLTPLASADERAALEAWFESFMTRVSQWFAMNTRWITVALAIVLAFTMHLDAVTIIKQLKNDTESRGKLVAMADSLLAQDPTAVETVEKHYTEAMKDLLRGNAAKFDDGVTENSVTTIASRPAAEAWLMANAKAAEKPALMEAYAKLLGDRLQSALDKSIDRAKTLQGQLSSAGIAIFPSDHTSADWLEIRSAHFWGMAASVLFLSLGAPFWFNLLKQMTQLKSVVAAKDEADERTPARPSGARAIAPMDPAVRAARLPALPAAKAAAGTSAANGRVNNQ